MAGINNSFRGGRSRESRSPRLEKPSLKYGPSTVAVLKVVRQSEMGAFLDAETGNTNDDILLHKTQQTGDVHIGDMVKVFLYLDPKHRLTASMRVPKLKEGQIARMRVINVSKDGAFLDVGAERGIFMPYAGMTISTRERAEFRNNVIDLAATKISAGVSTGIGGHGNEEEQGDDQFEIADNRNVDQVVAAIRKKGLSPVMNEYVFV